MSITSFSYLGFVAVVLILYYAVKPAWQSRFLLLVSLIFYVLAGEGYTIIYLVVSTISTYYAAKVIHAEMEEKKAKRILTATLLLNFGILAIVKYYGFILWNVNAVRGWFGSEAIGTSLHIAASLGVSYYTLQLVGYLLDCYWKVGMVQTDFLNFALFACYFPQMTSGPISRYKQIQADLYKEHRFHYDQVTHGLKRMAWGFFKKMAIADVVAIYVDAGYSALNSCTGLDLLCLVLFFTIQIYCDFSGYSDIAIGTAKLFGINLMTNFKSPYFSASLKEFWSRWHISLSTWFRDYVYIPLGGADVHLRKTIAIY